MSIFSLTPASPSCSGPKPFRLRAKSAAISISIHALAAFLLLTITFPRAIPLIPAAVHLIAPAPLRPFKPKVKANGGGGARQPIPASRGRIPPAVHRQFIPPAIQPEQAPKLVVLSGLAEAPVNVDAPQIGDPFATGGVPSGGIGIAGVGAGKNGGVGNGQGPNQGSSAGFGANSGVVITRDPLLLHKEEPEFTEEARKARRGGTVLVAFEVDVNGRPVHIRVVRGLGMGLDENATEAVSRWRFRPAMAGNRPVAAPATAALTFHLL